MYDSKVCFKCEVEKPLHEFYKHYAMADGHVNKCKECNKKDVRENREKNIDYYREYDKNRYLLPKRVDGRRIYAQSEEGKKSIREARKRYQENNLIKRYASQIVNNAIRDGKITKLYFCEKCGEKNNRIHGHHDDYAFPLSVRWLCPKCHTDWHKLNGCGKNG